MSKKIKLQDLNKYGFTDEILTKMVEFDIMFPLTKKEIKGETTLFVSEDDLIMFLNRMLDNTMSVYKLVEDANNSVKSTKDTILKAPSLSEYIDELENQKI